MKILFDSKLQNSEKFVICHKLNINHIDEKMKRNITLKHQRNFIEKKNSRFKNIIELKNILNFKSVNINRIFNFIAQ